MNETICALLAINFCLIIFFFFIIYKRFTDLHNDVKRIKISIPVSPYGLSKYGDRSGMGKCPSCGNNVYKITGDHDSNECPICYQKLDWSALKNDE